MRYIIQRPNKEKTSNEIYNRLKEHNNNIKAPSTLNQIGKRRAEEPIFLIVKEL